MRQLLLCCALALAALAARAEVIDIDSAQLAQMTKNGVTVIDIRTKPEWEETGIVPGSKLLTFFDERGKADPAAWLDKVKPLAGPNDPVIVICRSGNRTKAVSQFLSQQAGYAKVYNVKSGIKGWIADKGAIVPATQSIAACQAAKNLLTQAVDRKRCASCERWQGERQPGATPDVVLIEAETATGLCIGGGWDNSERRARSACGHWKRWAALEPAEPDANR